MCSQLTLGAVGNSSAQTENHICSDKMVITSHNTVSIHHQQQIQALIPIQLGLVIWILHFHSLYRSFSKHIYCINTLKIKKINNWANLILIVQTNENTHLHTQQVWNLQYNTQIPPHPSTELVPVSVSTHSSRQILYKVNENVLVQEEI